MNLVRWILQAVLAALFVAHGWLLAAPPADLAALPNLHLPPGVRTCIGVAELLAAVGLIVPGVTRILPSLTWMAAAGLMLVTAGATRGCAVSLPPGLRHRAATR